VSVCTGGQSPQACPCVPCSGCPRTFVWPNGGCEHSWRHLYSDSGGEHSRCDRCGMLRTTLPWTHPETYTLPR
jgi:hypothetical protein